MHDVVLLLEYPSINGGENSLLAVVDHVRQAGFRFHAIVPAAGPLADELTRRNVRIVPFEFVDESRQRRALSAIRADLAEQLRQLTPSLVHANSVSTSRVAGPVCRELGIPGIGHLRDIVHLSATALEDVGKNRQLLAVSRATRDFYVASGISAEQIAVLYNGVDLHRFSPRPSTGWLHEQLGLATGFPLVGCIGQIALRKGWDVFLQAAQHVAARQPEVHFIAVGERYSAKEESRRYEEELHRASFAAPLRGRVHFLGRREDIPDLLNELTVVAHAARQEPLGRVLLEAAACGKAIVATRVGGTEEILGGEHAAGRLVPPNDPERLGSAILELLADPNQRDKLGAAARRVAVERFPCRAAAAQLVERYQTVIGAGQGNLI